MKKIMVVILSIAVFSLLLCGCAQQPTYSDPVVTNNAEAPVETQEIANCLADGEAYNEEEFHQGILRNEGLYAAWGLLENWDYYYHPVYVPREFKLINILFAGGYLVYRYINEADELYEFVWNVSKTEESVRGYGKEIDVPGETDDMYITSKCGMDFYEAKSNEEYRASRNNSIYGDGWSMTFITQGSVFNIGMPFSVNYCEAELGKMIQVEKVYIKGR
ncbi:MAG: hypothetical protein FWE59_02355 [Oscillospiraceae bacterium]|nr:hypothetical protein [Oscillospiraceae bacterium]